MTLEISEINIVPIKPQGGKVAHASCVLNNSIYLGSLAIYTRLGGGFRIVYPTKKNGLKDFHLFHPINKKSAQTIEIPIINKYEEVMKNSYETEEA